MSVIVKICGLSTPEMVDAALEAGADMLGFVQCAKSPRHVSLERAEVLGRQVGSKAAKVLVTVDIDDQALADAIEALKPDALQLHGHESAERVGALRKRFGLPVIKAIGIGKKSERHRSSLVLRRYRRSHSFRCGAFASGIGSPRRQRRGVRLAPVADARRQGALAAGGRAHARECRRSREENRRPWRRCLIRRREEPRR